MTTIRDLLGEALGVGETYRLRLEERDGRLVAEHPNEASPMDIAVVEGLDRLEKRPPAEPVTVKVLGRVVDRWIAVQIIDVEGEAKSSS